MADDATYYILRLTVPQSPKNPQDFDVTSIFPLDIAGFSYSAYADGSAVVVPSVSLDFSYAVTISGGPGVGVKVNVAISSSTTLVSGAIIVGDGQTLAEDMSIVLVVRQDGQPSSTLPIATLTAGSTTQLFSVPVTESSGAGVFTAAEVLAFFAEQQRIAF